MGIKGLTKLLKEVAADGLQTWRLEDLSGARLAIDVSNFMYQFAYNAGAKKPANHLAGFFQLVVDLAKANILPVFILDGPSSAAKLPVLTQRRQVIQEREDRLQTLATDISSLTTSLHHAMVASDDMAAATKTASEVDTEAISQLGLLLGQLKAKQQAAEQLEKQQIKITAQMWTETVDFLQQLGVPVIQATSEADLLAANLARVGLVHGVISEDTDHLVFGAPLLIRDFNNKRNPDLQIYLLTEILVSSGLTYEQFVDLCILCGCDYTSHITGIGPATAYKFLRAGQNMTAIVANCQRPGSRYGVPDDFQPQLAQQLFMASDPLVVGLLADSSSLLPLAFEEEILSPLLQSRCHYRSETLLPKFAVLREWWQKCPKALKPMGWSFGPGKNQSSTATVTIQAPTISTQSLSPSSMPLIPSPSEGGVQKLKGPQIKFKKIPAS